MGFYFCDIIADNVLTHIAMGLLGVACLKSGLTDALKNSVKLERNQIIFGKYKLETKLIKLPPITTLVCLFIMILYYMFRPLSAIVMYI